MRLNAIDNPVIDCHFNFLCSYFFHIFFLFFFCVYVFLTITCCRFSHACYWHIYKYSACLHMLFTSLVLRRILNEIYRLNQITYACLHAHIIRTCNTGITHEYTHTEIYSNPKVMHYKMLMCIYLCVWPINYSSKIHWGMIIILAG